MTIIDSSPVAASLNYLKGQLLTRLKLRNHYSGSTAFSMKEDEFLDYARRVVQDYITYGANGDLSRIEGKSILEIGPGDNLSVALLLLANGAKSVTCVDAFQPKASDEKNRRIYRTLHSSLDPRERSKLDAAVSIGKDGSLSLKNDALSMLYGVRSEQLQQGVKNKKFDIILSRAVLEHVSNPEAVWREMHQSLMPDGEMWHKIDFRSHKYYTQIHPLYFLTVPEFWWKLVSSPDPTLNRRRLPFYREKAAHYFKRVDIFVTHILENEEILPHVRVDEAESLITPSDLDCLTGIMPDLPPEMRNLPVLDIVVGGIFIVCRDPVWEPAFL